MRTRTIYEVVRDAGMKWWDDRAMRMGAALAFYTALSLSPILLIIIAVSGLVFGEQAAQHQIYGQIQDLVGREGAQAVEATLQNAWSPTENIVATIVGLVMLLFAATGVVAELQDDLNIIWGVQPRSGGGVLYFLKDRVLSLAMILALGFLLLVSLVINAALTAISTYFTNLLPANWEVVLHLSNLLLTVGVTFLLFALIFKFLPQVNIRWVDVLIGAVITAALFMVGKYLIALYLGTSAVGSSYGAAGSFVVLLLWLYYSTLILLFGAELTQVYAERFGHGASPAAGAVALPKPAVGPAPAPASAEKLQPSA